MKAVFGFCSFCSSLQQLFDDLDNYSNLFLQNADIFNEFSSKIESLIRKLKHTLNDLFLVNPTRILFSYTHGKKFSSMETAHALTKYRERSTYGRGARASYLTMFPEISPR